MDESVLKAIARWPNVPDVFGWLSLDRRGNWRLKGDRIANDTVNEFIGRNYLSDDQGRWFFQNGPQRVFVSLAYTPYVLHTGGDDQQTLLTHTGFELDTVREAWLDEHGDVLLCCDVGIGVLCDRDLTGFAGWIRNADGRPLADPVLEAVLTDDNPGLVHALRVNYRDRLVPVRRIRSSEAPGQFGFDPSPQPAPGQPDC